jgi:putative lipase involved disintegration of autophagic bodies
VIPDLTDEVKLLHVGRMTVLRKARKDVAKKLRDRLIPMLNAIEGEQQAWDVNGIAEMVEEINQINQAIAALN